MKATVLSTITESSSKNFENKVAKLLPKGVNEIFLAHCGMRKASGYGSYYFILDIAINNGEIITLKSHTNDSQTWDNYQDLEAGTRKFDNFKKNIAISLLEDNKDRILELLTEDEE